MKRHFPQFHKIQYLLKILKMILNLKMSLFNINSKLSIVYENYGKCLLKRHFQYKPIFFLNYRRCLFKRHLQYNSIFGNCERCLLTPSTILKKLGLYWKCLFKRHFPQFPYIVENLNLCWRCLFKRHIPQKKKKNSIS